MVGTLPRETINSEDGVNAILKLLVKFNPTTYAHDVFTSFKALMQIRRRPKESFQLYVNRFEAAASQLRSLTSQTTDGEAEQFIAFQLLEGAQVPTAVFMQVLTNCVGATTSKPEKTPLEEAVSNLEQLCGQLSSEVSPAFTTSLSAVQAQARQAVQAAHLDELHQLATKVTVVKDILEETKAPLFADSLEGFGTVNVNFQSAKEALLALDAVSLEVPSTSRTAYQSTSNREAIEKIVRQTLLTTNADRSPPQARKGQKGSKKKKTYAQRIAERKAKTKCKDCGLKGHWAGDPQCKASSETQIAQAALLTDHEGQKNEGTASHPPGDSFFQ